MEKIGNTTGVLYGGRKPRWRLEDQIAGEMDRVRHFKMKKAYDQALGLVDEVLEKAPESAEARLLKARVLAEGFGQYDAAEACLKEIFKTGADHNDPARRWAYGYYKEIKGCKVIERNEKSEL